MMEKLAQAGQGGGARQPPFTIFTITYKVAVYAPAERADTLLLFHLYPYLLCAFHWFQRTIVQEYPKLQLWAEKVTFQPKCHIFSVHITLKSSIQEQEKIMKTTLQALKAKNRC